MKKTDRWFEFCQELKGFYLLRNGSVVPKFIIFHQGYSADKIKTGTTNVKLKIRT